MAAINVNRQAISAAFSRGGSSRLVHTSSRRRAVALSATTHVSPQIEEITLQPIFDIFDAPTRLSETSEFIRAKYKASSNAVKASTSYTTTMFPSSYSMESKYHPTTLPPPIVFDGPARPRNAALALKARMRQARLTPSARGSSRPVTSSTTIGASSTRLFSSDTQIEMFDGPARIMRYHHNPSDSDRFGSIPITKLAFALGVAGTIGYATTLAKELETSR
ncbi:hypothetical protein CPB83DRAFT_833659 [Crepidotus variabilis]|uniref:Uncharacterized protein n=1 Tax=Crepidotus variabilis TaxID=179855 RepID=A0A9P6JS81_9AGAR|nr:hypothetical protein CPB83DRAFT_833659 [Crepidotus variabilis]